MLTIRNLSFTLGGTPIFRDASASVPPKTTVGIVGRNGTGKTTLFRLIRGDLQPDRGDDPCRSRARIGGVAQEAPGDAGP